MLDVTVLPDEAARHRIAHSLDETLFVSAGAGSGKTASLVERVVALVVDGGVDLAKVAAITFTDKAASELRDRLRHRFDEIRTDPRSSPERMARANQALGELDGAAMSTLHAFAQRLLRELPVEAGLPPGVEVLDEIASEIEFERRWSTWLDDLLERASADAHLRRALLVATAGEVDVGRLRALALELNANWDRVEEHRPQLAAAPPVPDLAHRACRLAQRAATVAGHRSGAPEDDKFTDFLHQLAPWAVRLEEAADDVERVVALTEAPRTGAKQGSQAKWRKALGPSGADTLVESRVEAAEVLGEIDDLVSSTVLAASRILVAEVARFTLDAVAERQADGRLEFHDLLVLARRLLTTSSGAPEVRARLHDRYQRLLLDEFQDTDPIQIELAVRIAAAPADEAGHWSELDIEGGRLFFVGDPKQSIYRFRRADIELFLAARHRYRAGLVSLATNFRTVDPILQWVNHTFGCLIQLQPGAQPEYEALTGSRGESGAGPAVVLLGGEAHGDEPNAAELRRREAIDVAAVVRRAVDEEWEVFDRRTGQWRPATFGDVAVLLPTRISLDALEDAFDDADVPYRAEASSLVYVAREVRDLLMVARAVDDPTDELAVVSSLRSAAFGCSDRELFAYRHHHDGPWNHQARRLSRRPTGDSEEAVDPLPPHHPVVEGLRWLRHLHRDRNWLSPSEVLDRIARERRLFEQGVSRGRARDVWRRLRFVLDQARAWSETGGGGLREYLAWAERQAGNQRVGEAVLPETDDTAVRVMTVHAAKGLEFPITVLAGTSGEPARSSAAVRVMWCPTGIEYRLARSAATPEFADQADREADLEHQERLRLLYVACTRAQDHLVVSCHRTTKREGKEPHRQPAAAVLAGAGRDGPHTVELPAVATASGSDGGPDTTDPASHDPDAHRAPSPADVPPASPDAHRWAQELTAWQRELAADLAAAAVPRTWSATALAKLTASPVAPDELWDELSEAADPTAADDEHTTEAGAAALAPEPRARPDPGLEKDAPDLELPIWHKGRYGTAVGRAVHAVLQTVDLATGAGHHPVDDPDEVLTDELRAGFVAAVAAQAATEGVTHLEGLVGRLVWSGLTSRRVGSALGSARWWREVYVGAPIDDVPVEGYLDLLYRSDDGDGTSHYTVVDYKTDLAGRTDVDDAVHRSRLLARYAGQGATYALAVEAIVRAPVRSCVFLLLTESGASELVLSGADLAAAKADVRGILSGGAPLAG